MTSSLSPEKRGEKDRESKSLSPRKKTETENEKGNVRGIETKNEDENKRGKDFDNQNEMKIKNIHNKNNLIDSSSTLEYPGKRNLVVQIPLQIPQGTKRRPDQVYRDLIQKDEERQERMRQAHLDAEVHIISLFLFFFSYFCIFIFSMRSMSHSKSSYFPIFIFIPSVLH